MTAKRIAVYALEVRYADGATGTYDYCGTRAEAAAVASQSPLPVAGGAAPVVRIYRTTLSQAAYADWHWRREDDHGA